MEKREVKYRLRVFVLVVLLLSCMVLMPLIKNTQAQNIVQSTAQDKSVVWDEEFNFDSVTATETKFGAYFVSTQNERRADKLEYSWKIKDHAVSRTNHVDKKKDTVNIGILTYLENIYDDFELQIDFKMGFETQYWPVIGIRQQIPGKYYATPGGGAGIFMQGNGKITVWGPIVSGSIVEKKIPNANEYHGQLWHTMNILAEGTSIQIKVDGILVLKLSVATTDYTKGYISLLSVNNDCSFQNFKIRALNSSMATENEENKYIDAEMGTPLDDLIS